ncbi:MAG: hypothetical protein ACM3RP_07770 [Chitinophagales bacterium]
MRLLRRVVIFLALLVVLALAAATLVGLERVSPPPVAAVAPFEGPTRANAARLLEAGREIFRYDTFGDETFWGGALRLHQAIAGARLGGVGPGLSPKHALGLGLKVDADKLPARLKKNLRAGLVDLGDPATTLALLRLDAVVGVRGFFTGDRLTAVGVTCSICHANVDDSFSPGIGRRRDGWANRDLNIGAIIALAPDLQPIANLLGIDQPTVRTVLQSWGPGKFDAVLSLDGKAFAPDGRPAAVLIPPTYGLAGVNLHMWTGFGSIPYWNAYVAVLQMHGQGTFFDERLNDPVKYPIAARTGQWNVRSRPDLVTSKLAALHFYQLSQPAPKPPAGSFNRPAARRGEAVFNGPGRCARCHVPPLFVEPGANLHLPSELGIDAFQADRSPTRRYKTAPLKGLWAHQKGGFFHDGRFPTLRDVVDHYDANLALGLTEGQKADLVEYLKSL